jgi:glutamate-ammonia-ligase adenylyltransferase
MQAHVKLGPGGIREIEFIAQVYQLIRGGHYPALQIRPTLSVLQALVEYQLIEPQTEAELREAYIFLRRLEHRLQYIDDQQTHTLPSETNEQTLIASAMGFATWTEMLAVLDAHRDRVSQHFGAVFSEPGEGEHALTGLWLGQLDTEDEIAELQKCGLRQPEEAATRLAALRNSSRYQQLPVANRERLDAVGPRLIEACAATPNPDSTLAHGLQFLESISRRGAYLALLQQYPLALKRVADLMGASSWAADYLTRHLLLLDQLLDASLLETATDWPGFRADLQHHLAHHADDIEREMDILREMHHAQVFRLLVQDLAGLHSIERISDHLTELADIIVQETLPLIWNSLKTRHRDQPRFAVIGYGKLGGKELGYVADLDLVFLYDDDHPDAPENYAKLSRRLATWLSTQTAAGMLFEADFRLRPNGESGLLAVSVDAFRNYQLQKAWVWEHQALSRARFCAGDGEIGQRFEAIRCEVLCRQRDLATLKQEVLAMRQKMLDAHASHSATHFNLKQDRGGLIDVEFIVQTLVLGHAHQHPQLTANLGNIALLKMSAEIGLIPADEAEGARTAYREYRRLQHANRLNGHPDALIERMTVQSHIDAVCQLWQTVFNQTGA